MLGPLASLVAGRFWPGVGMLITSIGASLPALQSFEG